MTPADCPLPSTSLAVADSMLVQLEAAELALEAASTLTEVARMVEGAEALRVYVRQAHLSHRVANRAGALKLRAQRKAGLLLRETKESGERAAAGDNQWSSQAGSTTTSLRSLGVSYNESSRWQQIAQVPDRAFAQWLVEAESRDDIEITTAGFLRSVTPGKEPWYAPSESNEWYTPSVYIEAVRELMGGIDLDPASCEQAQETVQAGEYYTQEDDGLAQPWHGRVFLNPPYGDKAAAFVEKLIEDYESGSVSEAVLIVNAYATERAWFQPLFDYPLCFMRGRIQFDAPPGQKVGNNTSSSAFIYFGSNEAGFIQRFAPFGRIVRAVDMAVRLVPVEDEQAA